MPKIVLIGAGSLQFGLSSIGDIFATPELRGSTITLLDINKDTLHHVYTEAQNFLRKNDPKNKWQFTIEETIDRKKALKGADFVIISIEVGDRFALWDMDRTIAQQYGIRQVYGENGGPGGLFHALRIVPPILDICKDVQAICPNATVFNFSNPMSRICTTVHRAFPKLNFVGLCHEVASLERYLPTLLGKKFESMDLVAGGLNHFSVLLSAKDKKTKKDLYPLIKQKAKTFFGKVPSYCDYMDYARKHGVYLETEGVRKIANIPMRRKWAERTLFKFVLEHFDLLPITSDSHFGEYISWAYDVADHQGILDFYRYYREYLGKQKHAIELKIKERPAVIIGAMVANKPYIEAAVNVPNKGPKGKFIAELPEWICVEVPGRISKKGVEGVVLPVLPRAFAGLLSNQIAIHDMNAEAILTKSKKAVVQALLVDSVNTAAVNIPELVDVMIDYQKKYLGYLK